MRTFRARVNPEHDALDLRIDGIHEIGHFELRGGKIPIFRHGGDFGRQFIHAMAHHVEQFGALLLDFFREFLSEDRCALYSVILVLSSGDAS